MEPRGGNFTWFFSLNYWFYLFRRKVGACLKFD